MTVVCGWCTAPAVDRAVRDDGQEWAFCGKHSKKAIAAAGAIVRGKTTIAFKLVGLDADLGDEPDVQGEDMGDLPPACQWGPPAHCEAKATPKQHAKCAHHPGGGHHGGSMAGDGHLWTCPCKCHDDAGEIRPRCPHPDHGDADPAAAALLTAALAGIDVDLAYAVEGAAAGNALTVLEYLTAVVAAANRARQVAVDVAKSRELSWQLVGDVLGVTKQSAQERWGDRASRSAPAQPGATLLDVLAQDDSARYGADAASGSRP